MDGTGVAVGLVVALLVARSALAGMRLSSDVGFSMEILGLEGIAEPGGPLGRGRLKVPESSGTLWSAAGRFHNSPIRRTTPLSG